MKKLIFILIIFFPIRGYCQNTSEYEQQIEFYIKYLENAPKTDTINLENIFLISRRNTLRKRYIKTLQQQIRVINQRINHIQTYINDLEKKLDKTKQIYSQMLVFTYLYKNYFPSDIIFILSAKSFNQAYLRLKFLELSTKYLKSLTKVITLTKHELEYQKKILQQSVSLRRQLIKRIKRQQAIMQEEFAMLNSIKENSSDYQRLLRELKNYEFVRTALNRSVSENIKETSLKGMSELSSAFANNKGLLKPPLKDAVVVIPFGVHQHPQLKTVKIRNDGVDITSNTDSVVKAVFNGIVSNIITLPNGKNAVLIKHGEYFTVYSNLASIKVKQNDTVITGQAIGIINSVKGEKIPVLNFQLWHLSEKLNPEEWLNL